MPNTEGVTPTLFTVFFKKIKKKRLKIWLYKEKKNLWVHFVIKHNAFETHFFHLSKFLNHD